MTCQGRRSSNPAALATDVGPVIDVEALDNIGKHLKCLSSSSKVLLAHVVRAPAAINSIATDFPDLIPPAAFEVASLFDVKDEILGPVLQIVCWGSGPKAGGPALSVSLLHRAGHHGQHHGGGGMCS